MERKGGAGHGAAPPAVGVPTAPEVSLDAKILAGMPYPLAHLYQALLDAEEPRQRFESLVTVFAGGLKYLSIVCIADYTQGPGADPLNRILSHSLKQPSLGQWALFLRAIVGHYRDENREFQMRELASVLDERTLQLVAHLIHLRNTYIHPDRPLAPEAAAQLCDESLPLLQELLLAFRFVSRYPLIRRDRSTGEEERVMGSEVRPARPGGGFEVLVRAAPSVDLDITPFILLSVDDEVRDVLVYETLIGDHGKYILGKHVRFIRIGDEPDNRVRLLQGLIERFGRDELQTERRRRRARRAIERSLQGGTFEVRAVRYLASYHSEQTFEDYKKTRRFEPRAYVERRRMTAVYDELAIGDKNCLVLVADSGGGKTTEICQLYLERFSGDIVWVLSGRRTRSAHVLADIDRHLFEDESAHSLSSVLAALDRSRSEERFVILFDGVNETEDPVEAFRQINDLIDTNPYPWLKVVVTCRSFAWERIERSALILDRRRYLAAEDGRLAVTLQPFDEAEVGEALERYGALYEVEVPRALLQRSYAYRELKLFSHPVMLRFVFEAFQGRGLPSKLDFNGALREFTRARLRERDLPFLEQYLMSYLYCEETDILDAARLLERRGAMAPDDSERAAYDKLAEHICGEQIYDIDEVWICLSEGCPAHGRPVMIVDSEQDRCALCRSKLRRENVDNRSTFSRLQSENILSTTDLRGRVLVRMVFDRYFDYLMGRYCFVERMAASYAPEVVDELYGKARRNGLFIEPARSVLHELWLRNDLRGVLRVASQDDVTSYYILRELFRDLTKADLAAVAPRIREVVEQTGFRSHVCRAVVYGVLIDGEAVRQHPAGEVVELLVFVSRCASEQIHDDIDSHLVRLRKAGVDLISPLIDRCGEALLSELSVRRGLRVLFHSARRDRFRSMLTLFVNTILFGLGSYFDDPEIRGAVLRNGLAICQRVLNHPLLSFFERPLSSFLARYIANIYRTKGPLPCNYFEMLFQLKTDPAEIRRAGDLFFVDRRNLFELDFEAFQATVHSENGLMSWYMLSLLPVHYLHAQDRERAASHLRRFATSGTEMDRYVVGQTLSVLLWRSADDRELLEALCDELEAVYLNDPSQIFLHPEPLSAITGARSVAAYNRDRTKEIGAQTSLPLVPWIVLKDGKLFRFYLNSVAFELALRRLQREQPDEFTTALDLLERNSTDDLLRFEHDLVASRRFVAGLLIQSVGYAGTMGHLRPALATIERIIARYLGDGGAEEDAEVYRAAVVKALTVLRDSHPNEVLAFLERYDLDRERYAFLAEIERSAEEGEDLLGKSLYGHKIYQGSFCSSRQLRETFGEATRRAAEASDVEEFFLIYSRTFIQWLKRHPGS